MTADAQDPPTDVPDIEAGHPFAADLDAERRGWYEMTRLVRSLDMDERLTPGYYRGPDWSVRDVVAHLGAWLAEAEVQLERMTAGSYEGHDIDVDALNASFLEGLRDQPWEVAWIQANAGRTRMLQVWVGLGERTDEAVWWIRKSGADHYAEHLGRLAEWSSELRAERRPGRRSSAGPQEPT